MYRLKKWLPLLLVLFAGSTTLLAQTSSFNFSYSVKPVTGWINVHGDPIAAVRTGIDSATGFQVSSISTANWYSANGICANDNTGQPGATFFPSGVINNTWDQYGPNGSTYSQYNAAVPQLVVSGLNPDTVYTFRMTGSLKQYIGTYELNPIDYTVTGAVVNGPIPVNGDYNAANGATFKNIAPDATGKVKIYVNTYGSANVASICGVQIITGRVPGPAPSVSFTRPLNGNILPEDANVLINVNATDSVSNISRVEFYLGTTLLGVDSTTPYSYTWVDPTPGSYLVSARAIDALGYSASASVNFTVESLNYFWSTTGNIATGGDTSFIGTVDTNRLAFRTHNIERMSILGDGTVGIGTKDTKGYALAVNGKAIFTKVQVKTYGTWPDYVFKKDYHLPGLAELEKYITEHQHLPGIASEQEVRANGIDVGDHQAALLKKVEELTLYIIQQQKEIDELKALILEKNKSH